MSAARPMRPFLRPHRLRIAIAALAFIVKDSPLWVLPIVTAEVIDALIAEAAPAALVPWAFLAAAVMIVNVSANAVYVRAYFAAVRGLGADLRRSLTQRLQTLSLSYHSRSASALAQTKLVRDVENVELMLQQSFGPVLTAATVLVGASVTIGVRAPAFLVFFAVAVPLAVLLIRWLRSRTSAANERFRREVERFSTRISEMGSLLSVTRAHALEAVAVERVTSSAERVRVAGFDLDRINGRFGAMSWASFQVLSLACLFGAVLGALTGVVAVSAGDVILLSSYFGLLTATTVAVFQLAPLLTRGRESISSMQELLTADEVEQNEGKPALSRISGDIRFDAVTFAYAREPVLHDVDLTVAAGETVAFIGPSGSGKSTLLHLALGLISPDRGRVSIDGHDLVDIDRRTYRRFVSVVPQEPVLFAASIRENVAYGLPDLDDDAVWNALAGANAQSFVRQLPEGWDTVVGERGASLSGGQRQRLAIARALARDPRVLLLDEATAALDGESEAAVNDALATLRAGRTTLIVAHRLSTIRAADRIVVLDAGRVIQQGDHDALAATEGYYRTMLQRAVAT
ncbi:ABC transporter ATP-binding protein [Microbacterium sp. NPDC007973]|uniref:ABC transporter ATP-binding protein n=1 Tax=Microbacterium sp. NPDC007973 TaxID=3364182 RepID=UPI0036EFE462